MEVTEPVISDNVDTLIEGETNKSNDAEPNNLVITNTIELKDPLELSLEIEATYGLKPCFVELERCDKIWETIQLIRDLQEDPNSEISDDDNGSDVDADDDDNYDNDTVNNDDAETIVGEEDNSNAIYDDEPSSSHNDTESCSSTQNNPIAPYIKYQPVLDNGNAALPNFQFSVHRTRVLYPCVTCGKQYSHIRSLREHEERIHHIIQPPVRKRSDHNNKPNDTNLLNNQENQVANKNKLIEFIHSDKNTSNDDMLIVNSTEFIKSVLATEPGKKSSCCYCDKSYADKYSLKKHLVAVHGGDPGIVRTYKRKEPPQSLPEPAAAPVAVKCEEEVPQKKRRVERSRNLNVYRCETCGKHFYSQKNMRQHGRKVHGVYVRPPQKIIDSRKHIGNNNNNNNSNNNNNNKKGNEKTQVQTTLSISSNSLTYESPTKSKNSLKRKNATVRTCPICQVKLKDLGGFRTHCKKHGITLKFESLYPREQDKNDLDCNVCNKTFMTFNHVLEHYWNIHQRNLRYKCYICGSLSNNSEDLVTHLIKSHKIYLLLRKVNHAFKCHVCKNSFTNKDVYRMHMTQGHGLDVKTKQIERVLKSRARILSNPPRQTPTPTTRSLKNPRQIKRRIVSEKTRPSPSRSGLREKTKFNYDETVLLLDTALSSGGSSSDELSTGNKRARRSSNLSSEKINTSVNNDGPTELNPTEPTFCILCSKKGYRNIRKHFIEYHKVRSPDKLIEQCIQLTPASSKDEKKEIVTPVKTSGNNRRSTVVRKRIFVPKLRAQSIPGPLRTFVGVQGKNGIIKYICKYCPLTSINYEAMRRNERDHRLKDNIDSLTKPTNPGFLNLNPDLILKPRKQRRSDQVFKNDDRTVEVNRKSSTGITQSSNNKAPARRASFPLEQYQQHNRLTRGIVKLQEQIEHRCPICSRVFRNSDILASHKISCNVRVDNHQTITNETSDTRESSDRDSGISITIKKKNDSYEIVSRDNSNDTKSQDSENRQNDLLLSDIPTDNYLNQNDDDKSDKANNIIGSKNVPEYSKTHETIKIQKDDDNDEEIVIDADDQNINVPVIINKPRVSKKRSTIKRKPIKIPSLVVLCTRELDKKYVSDCFIRKCYICGTDWPSPLSRGSHITSFHSSSRWPSNIDSNIHFKKINCAENIKQNI